MKYLFYRPIRIKDSEHDVFFWSDTHFNHRCEHWATPLWKSRGFDSVEHHNESLIQRWNEVCTDNSVFFHLGDFIFGFDAAENFKDIVKRLSFKDLYIMPGNHNSGWKQIFEQQKNNVWNISSNKRVIFIPNYAETMIENTHLILSHYPILSFNCQSKGSICLYGHVHGNLAKNEIGSLYSEARTLEVCIETQPKPINLKGIRNILHDKSAVTFDHHI